MRANRVMYKGHIYVQAQDPAEVPAADDPSTEAPAELDLGLDEDVDKEETPKPEDPSETIQAIEDSPAANWRDYLQPILKDLKVRFNGVSISLLDPKMLIDGGDPDLGFHITGYIKFLNDTPVEVAEEYGNVPVHFKVFVDPTGKLHKESVQLYTEMDK